MRTIDHVVARFPDQRSAARLLYLKDGQFRDICEDFALALASLRGFEIRADPQQRPELEEYRALVKDLEDELLAYLGTADPSARSGA